MSFSPSLQGTVALKRTASSSNTATLAFDERQPGSASSSNSQNNSRPSSPPSGGYTGSSSRMSGSNANGEQQVPLMAASDEQGHSTMSQDGSSSSGKAGYRMVGMGEEDSPRQSVAAGSNSKAGGMILQEPAQSPVLPIASYCMASITMTVVNKVRARATGQFGAPLIDHFAYTVRPLWTPFHNELPLPVHTEHSLRSLRTGSEKSRGEEHWPTLRSCAD